MQDAIVMTGASSGFGAEALKLILEQSESNLKIIVGARDPNKITSEFGGKIIAYPLDLGSLTSVRQFAASINDKYQIKTLALNAGISTKKLRTTQDGFEETFQVNYLSHFLLFHLLEANLSHNAIIITTGSGTHDPDENTPAPPPRHANVRKLAYPDQDQQRDKFAPKAAARAYTASKLCCIMFAREIADRYPNLKSLSFDPGFLSGTSLSREHTGLVSSLIKRIIPYIVASDRIGTVESSAAAYAQYVLGNQYPSISGRFVSMRHGKPTELSSSNLAQDKNQSTALWEDSLMLLGLV